MPYNYKTSPSKYSMLRVSSVTLVLAKVHVRPGYPLSKKSFQKPPFYFWILCIRYTARAVHRGTVLLQYFCCRALRAGAALLLISPGELSPHKWWALGRWTEETYQGKGFWSNATVAAARYFSVHERDASGQRRTQQHSLWCHKKVTSRDLDLLRYCSLNQGYMVNANLKVIVKRRQCKRGVVEYLYCIIQC